MFNYAGNFLGESVDLAVELIVHRLGVGLVVDRVQQRMTHSIGTVYEQAPGGIAVIAATRSA